MDFKSLKNNSILIIPNLLKEKILLQLNQYSNLLNLKIMSLDEFKKKYYFDYTTQSICFLMKNYNFDYEFSQEIINYLYYINNDDYKDEKLNFLVQIKNQLIANNLLIYDDIFIRSIKNKTIYIYGYDYIDKFSKTMFNNLDAIFLNKITNDYDFGVYEFENINDEINFLASKICELSISKIPLSKIKIITPSSEYLTPIKRTFKMFNIPINLNNNYLNSTKIGNMFLNMIEHDINATLNKLQMAINKDDELVLNQYNQIINICNKYNWCSNFIEIKEALKHELKNTKLNLKIIENAINVVPIDDNVFDDDEIVFLIGFNQNNYPITYKNDEFISDELKNKINLETTSEKNMISYQNLIKNIRNIKNIYVSYKLKTPFNIYFKSQIVSDLNLKILKSSRSITHYSVLNDKLTLTTNLDNYLKYGVIGDDLKLLYSNYPYIDYNTYDNQYTGIDEEVFRNYLNNKLLLSYSSINNFYRCGFRYYIENILKIYIEGNNFASFIGNLFHYILSIMYNDNFDFENDFNNYVNNNYKISSYKEHFFINKLKQELIFIIDVIKEQDNYISFDKHLFEKSIEIDLSKDNYKIIFKGIIDKIMYQEIDNKTLISIIDYKTGNPNLNLNNIIYGLDMQLFIYAYLSSKMQKFKNPILVGIYLQKILNNEINIIKDKDYITQRKENLKLQGYSTDNEVILKQFDNTYTESKLIKSMKIGKNGFYAYSKVFNEDMLKKLLEIVDGKINQARDSILNREFFINPKKIGIKEYVGCEFCNFKEICHMKEANIVSLKKYNNLEFLEDDVYEMDK